ncbi:MAG: hypothetical protein V9G14_05465 [Cypionkella sp.]
MIAITLVKRRNWAAIGWQQGIIPWGLPGLAGRAWRLRIGLIEGEAPFDLWEVDIRRAQPFQKNRNYLKERVSRDARPALCRPLPLSPGGNRARACAARRCTSI